MSRPFPSGLGGEKAGVSMPGGGEECVSQQVGNVVVFQGL